MVGARSMPSGCLTKPAVRQARPRNSCDSSSAAALRDRGSFCALGVREKNMRRDLPRLHRPCLPGSRCFGGSTERAGRRANLLSLTQLPKVHLLSTRTFRPVIGNVILTSRGRFVVVDSGSCGERTRGRPLRPLAGREAIKACFTPGTTAPQDIPIRTRSRVRSSPACNRAGSLGPSLRSAMRGPSGNGRWDADRPVEDGFRGARGPPLPPRRSGKKVPHAVPSFATLRRQLIARRRNL